MASSGRGASSNPTHRFSSVEIERDPDFVEFEDEQVLPHTRFWEDKSQTILSQNDSPDVGFDRGINAYRGCEHGCAYCFARPTHEYLGYSAGLDFETNIHVKPQAAQLLRRELSKKSWKPQLVAMSGVTDCYQPAERKLRLTRQCLEVLLEFRNPVGIITKNYLVTRDIDLLAPMAEMNLVRVNFSITTLDHQLSRTMEPRASAPARRLRAVELLSQAGIPVNVMIGPTIPGLNDHEIPEILRRAAEAGAKTGTYIPLRLPGAVLGVFTEWLETNYPDRKDKVLNRIRELRGGRMNDPNFHSRFQGVGKAGDNLRNLYEIGMRRAGLKDADLTPLATHLFRVPPPQHGQLELF